MSDSAAAEQEERESIEAYCKQHGVETLVHGLVEDLLRDRPETRPKEHFAHLLRLQMIKEQMLQGDGEAALDCKASEVPGRMLVALFDATRRITSEIVPKDTINVIVGETMKLLNCDRVSFFVYDRRINMLVLNASNLEQPIRVKSGQGIAGHVFKTKDTINITHAYKDERFDQAFDKLTGYCTNTLLTMPVKDSEGESMGVLQAINKKDAACFNRNDEILMETFVQYVCIALRNAEVYRAALMTKERANTLIQMMQVLAQDDLAMQSIIMTIGTHAGKLVPSDHCRVFLVDAWKRELVSLFGGAERRVSCLQGIAGECATTAKRIVVADAHEHTSFNEQVDGEQGHSTWSVLAVPVLARGCDRRRALAVIQLVNKKEFDGAVGKFDDEDIQVVETLATFVAPELESLSFLHTNSFRDEVETQKQQRMSSKSSGRPSAKLCEAFHRRIIVEDEEEKDG